MALSRVNTTSGSADTGASNLAATAANHTTGNLIVVGVAWSNNTTANVPTDTAGNTYVTTNFKANNSTTDHVEIFYAKNITGNASNVVQANFSGSSTFRRIIVHQYSGADTTAPFTTGEGGKGDATSSTSHVTASWTTALADEVIFGFIGAGSGFTSLVGNSGNTKVVDLGDTASEDQIVSATGTYNGGFQWSGTITTWISGSSFSAPGTAVVAAPFIPHRMPLGV